MAKEKTPLTAEEQASIRAGSYQPGEGLIQTQSQKDAAGAQPASNPVSMDVLRDGSYGGEYHRVGSTIDVHADHVETLMLSGFAARADRAQAKASTEVAPMTTADVPGAEPPKKGKRE